MAEWRLDVFLARYGHQDIHKLRGIDRPLTRLEKMVFAQVLQEMLKEEFSPADTPPARNND